MRTPVPFTVAGNEDLPLIPGRDAWFRLGGDWSYVDAAKPYSGMRSMLFGHVVRHVVRVAQMLDPSMACGHYPSDLWHDAMALREYTPEQLIEGFRLSADDWGTWLHPVQYDVGDRKFAWVFQAYAHQPYTALVSDHIEWFLHVTCERAPVAVTP